MKRSFFLATAVTIAALVSMGCTKKELIRQNDGASPASAAQATTAEGAKAPPETVVTPPTVAEASATPALKASVEGPVAGDISMGLETIFFNFDSAILSEQARTALQRNAEVLRRHLSARIRIEGHCDEIGSDEYNLVLGEKRARAAMQYLMNLGIPAQRLAVISYGEERPASPGHDEVSLARNRRDEFVIIQR